jgi:predicted dehydrogenase
MYHLKPVEYLIVGAGSRGTTYGEYALVHPEQARVVGVAEPRAFFRTRMARQHRIAPERTVSHWQQLARLPKCADAVVIATPDAQHLEPAIAFAQKGYDILLEKPLAPDPESCRRIIDAVEAAHVVFAVGHVMRYTDYTQRLKALVSSGLIGEIVSIQHVEPVGYWHYAHSFVRGNWRNEAESSFMLLAKSCHDVDWLRYIMGCRCIQVSSFGSLLHFKLAAKPAEAGNALRCLDCAYEPHCPYSAKSFYLQRLQCGDTGWPLDVIAEELTEEGIMTALRAGPYGRCVYECDNDVVDHQVVNLLYETGATASFTMIGTSEPKDRQTTIYGTRGELRGDGEKILHYDFLTAMRNEVFSHTPDARTGGHNGGDYALMKSFVAAVAHRDASLILSGPTESLETHLTVFAAERARREQTVVQI